MQNVGAYGQEVSQSIATVRVWDRGRGKVRTLPLVTLAFGYRTSLLKRSMREADPADPQAPWSPTPRYVVLDVTFQLRPGDLSRPIAYAELARTLGVEVGGRAPLGGRPRHGARPCAPARAWCSTRPTTTPGARARSSPTRS